MPTPLGKVLTGLERGVDRAVDATASALDTGVQRAAQVVERGAKAVFGSSGASAFDGAVQSAARAIESGVSEVRAGVDTSMGPLDPAPALKRPVVMITGLTMAAKSFDPMAQHLASNAKNGPVAVYVVADGQFHQGSVTGPAMDAKALASAKLFEVQYMDANASPTEKAPQIAQALTAIGRATGTADVDVVCHSAGCTDFRLYLQQRQGQTGIVGIDHAVFIGPASHGTEMGNLGKALGGPLGLDAAGAELAVGAPLVGQLNDTWASQRDQVKGGVTVIGLTGAPTASANGLTDGDGFMPIDEVGMPGATTVTLHGNNPTPLMHLWEVQYSGVINAVGRALAD